MAAESRAAGRPSRQIEERSCQPPQRDFDQRLSAFTGLSNNLNISFAGVDGESLLMGINDIAVSSGSACTSAMIEPSYVLRALGVSEDLAHSSIRFGLGRFNTEEEVDYVVARVVETVERLRELSPLLAGTKTGTQSGGNRPPA